MNQNRRVVVFAVIAVIGVVALWWVLIYSPKAHTLSDARDARDNAQREAQTLQAQLNQLKDLQDRSTQIEAQLGKLTAAIPKAPNQAAFISSLNDIADSSGITWQSVTMQNPTAGTGGSPETIAVQIQLQGGFFQVLDYFNRLEDLNRLVVVDSINVSTGSGSGGSASKSGGTTATTGVTSSTGGLTATLNGRIFSQNALDGSSSPGTGTSNGSTGSGESSTTPTTTGVNS